MRPLPVPHQAATSIRRYRTNSSPETSRRVQRRKIQFSPLGLPVEGIQVTMDWVFAAWRPTFLARRMFFIGSLLANGNKYHPQLMDRIVQQLLLVMGQITSGFFLEHDQRVDVMLSEILANGGLAADGIR